MATVEDLRLFIQERLRAYDPKVRLEDGSPASVQIVEPVVRRFSPDALETDPTLFINTRLRQEFPSMFTGEGSALADTLVKPLTVLLEPFIREIRAVKRNQSLLDPAILNKDEADALVSNTYAKRSIGKYTRGKVRAYFENPVSANIGGSNVAFTASGKRFLPIAPQSITSEAMLFNADGELYYFDIDYVAEGIGESYNVDASEIIGITNLPAATRVTNLKKFQDGLNEETTMELVARAEKSIGERSLASVPGIIAKLFNDFPELRILQVIGFNDAEMRRDIISGGALGDPVIANVDGATVDDGDGDGYTPYLSSAGGGFTTSLGPVGTDISDYMLTVWYGAPLQPHDFRLGEVMGATQLRIADSYEDADRLPDNLVAAYWVVRRRSITLSEIPGGILFPTDISGRTVEIKSGEIHVGGCTDFYVIGPEPEDKTVPVALYGDNEAALQGLTATTHNDATFRQVDLVGFTLADSNKIIVGTSSLRLKTGADVGTYRITSKSYDVPTLTIQLLVEFPTPFAAAANILFDVINSVDIRLTDPEEIIKAGTDLRTYAGSTLVDTGSGVVWASWGVTTDHFMRILNGEDVGLYPITLIAGTTLRINTVLDQTADPIQYAVVKRQTAAVQPPLLRVTKVELLDASLEPTGDIVPFRHPVDVVSTAFQNPGRGAKAGTDDPTTDDTLAVNILVNRRRLTSSNALLNYYALGVRPGDIVNILTGDNTGFYTVAENGVGGSPGAVPGLSPWQLLVTADLRWTDATMSYAVGEPSLGSFRMFFLDPVGVRVDQDTLFSIAYGDGTVRRYRPDPQMWDAYLPTDVTVPTFGVAALNDTIVMYPSGGGSALWCTPYGIEVGDRVEITFAPIVGSKDLALPPGTVNLNGKTLLLDLGRGPEKIVFTGTLSIDGIISQLNSQASRPVAAKRVVGAVMNFMLRSNEEVTLLDNSADANDATALIFGLTPATYNPWLTQPTFAGEEINNDSPYKGYWYAGAVSTNSIDLVNSSGAAFNPTWAVFGPTGLGHYIIISRPGRQRISATQMAQQRDEMGLYYFDVECISEGHGDTWNATADLQATVTGYESEGWDVTTEDSNTSFSMAEVPWLHISPRVILEGSQDDPVNYEELAGRSFQISYERSPLVEELHSYARSQMNRDVCENILVRALTPIYVRTNIQYRSGDDESDVRAELVDLIEGILPDQYLEVSDMVEIIMRGGSTYVQLPITVIGIRHNTDRTVAVERSQNMISIERLSALIPDDDGTTTEGSSWLQLTRS